MKTDDDKRREIRLQNNLLAFKDDLTGMASRENDEELSFGGNDLVELERALECIDLHTEVEVDDYVKKPMQAPMMEIIKRGIARNKADYEENRERMLEAWRAVSRKKSREAYAEACADEGREVRSYIKHPYLPGETAAERRKRLHREGARRRRGKTSNTVRPYEPLSGLTDSERRDRKRLQNAASQRAGRAARRADAAIQSRKTTSR